MINLFWIFFSITILFFILIISKQFFKGKAKDEFCALCLAVSLTWLFLLVYYWRGLFFDKTLLALLMGMSGLGIFYMAEKKVEDSFKIFRLPFLLTLILIIYLLIERISNITGIVYFVLSLWIIFFIIYAFRENEILRGLVKKIVECCRKW